MNNKTISCVLGIIFNMSAIVMLTIVGLNDNRLTIVGVVFTADVAIVILAVLNFWLGVDVGKLSEGKTDEKT